MKAKHVNLRVVWLCAFCTVVVAVCSIGAEPCTTDCLEMSCWQVHANQEPGGFNCRGVKQGFPICSLPGWTAPWHRPPGTAGGCVEDRQRVSTLHNYADCDPECPYTPSKAAQCGGENEYWGQVWRTYCDPFSC